ncbi:PREDICTED: double-stranded RNA-binding protein 4-like [Ipomoea nil]|uniref:double-stranded RNA-binding protein 4-like n=1 Tax=Ipomoea nil TaxID=35883 RepID=UPI0009014D23|nr:PREDICTED: double-stranded RNA-binding protein 4-like [Ipomoea nil]
MAALLPSTEHPTQIPDNSSQTGNPVVEVQNTIQKAFNDYKFFLDDLTQKANILKPTYEVRNEGPEHAPRYRATVLVCGKRYTSHTTFTQQRIAEQDAARVALDCIPPNAFDNIAQKTDDVEKLLDIEEYALLCKSILNVFAMRMHFHKPTYNAIHIHPNVKSVVSFNGKNYTGEPAKHKKKADQLAARAAILSLLESKLKDALLNTIISEAEQVFAKLNDVGEDDSMINAIESLLSGSETVSSAQVMSPPNHEFNKPVVQSSTVSVALPKSLRVPPSVQQYIQYVHRCGQKRKWNDK